MAHMVAGSLLVEEALYFACTPATARADNPVLGGRSHLSSRNGGNTYAEMLDRMLSALQHDPERFRHRPGRPAVSASAAAHESRHPEAWPASWLFVAAVTASIV